MSSQPTISDDNCASCSDDSSSVFQPLSQLAKDQFAAAKEISDLASDLRNVKNDLQHLQRPETSPTNSSCK